MRDVFLQDLWFHRVESIVIENAVSDGKLVVVRARASAKRAACPACSTTSGRVHSRYVRRLADTAVGGRHVVIELQVRRFRCRDRACRQATFAEQVDGLTFRHGRRSAGLQTVLQQVDVMLAGRAGARLAETLAVRANGRFSLAVDSSDVYTALEPLLDHSEDSGDGLSPTECASLLVRLKAISDQWAREDGDQPLQQHRGRPPTGGRPAALHRKGRPAGLPLTPTDRGTRQDSSSFTCLCANCRPINHVYSICANMLGVMQ
ncbi:MULTISPECIES: transposase family protein [Streptomyces]|uniref:Transposase family protein n=1 Tax=Streptomyces galilaeus TaxID=33899 RepID=A0ABW9J034_STRGJ